MPIRPKSSNPAYRRPEADPPIQPPEPSKELSQKIERLEAKVKSLEEAWREFKQGVRRAFEHK